ncbi:MAG: chorismate lyase [Euryarchaeota archaeon]|nr:chorismate lyase [Euryarchaeota archaeon]
MKTIVQNSDTSLSKAQRLLLFTDGSVTTLLEVMTGKPVTVTTLVQRIVKADTERATALDIEEGDNINYRVVVLRNRGEERPLIYAESFAPIARLQKEFRHDLMKADVPIGKIMKQRRIESRREIRSVEVVCNEELSDLFGVPHDVHMLSRVYDIISNGLVLMRIHETFPVTYFAQVDMESS